MSPDSIPPSRMPEWLKLNAKIGFLSFGAAGRSLLYRDALVTKRQWVSENEFNESMTVSQILPGPNLVNLCLYMGYQLAGWRGAVLGSFLLILPGSLMLIAMYEILGVNHPEFDVFFNGISVGSITLFVILVWRMLSGLQASANANVTTKFKVGGRYAVALVIAVCSLMHVGIFWLLGLGAALGLACEFLL